MAILEVVLRQQQNGQEIINRWNYFSNNATDEGGLSVALIDALGGNPDDMPILGQFPANTFLRRIQEVQSAAVDFIDISVRDVFSTTDFWETPFPPSTNGTVAITATTQPMPPFTAFGFTTNRIRTDIKRGQKRFVGVPENAQQNGVVDTGWLNGGLTQLADKMSETLIQNIEGINVQFAPTVCGKEGYTTPSGRTAYRYWTTYSKQLEMSAVGVVWQPKDTVRSQVSRQIGRGR